MKPIAHHPVARRLAVPAIVACPILAIAIVAGVYAQTTAKAPALSPEILAFMKPVAVADADSELQKKLKERHNAAVTLLEERVSEYKSGGRDISTVLEAGRFVADAKLDLAESDEARVAALEQTLAVARLVENSLQQQVAKGFGSKGDLARARYGRIGVELELLKAKGK